MTIELVCPAPHSRSGNHVTAARWARLLRALGHRVAVRGAWSGRACELMVALHARRSAPSVARFVAARPGVPIVVALTGTDLYVDLPRGSAAARRTLARAWRIVALHGAAAADLPAALRARVRPIVQSARPARGPRRARRGFVVAVVGHLRAVKDPFRAEEASRRLPASSRVRVVHAGAALAPRFAASARRRMAQNPRYRWLGALPPARALRLLVRADVLALTSRLEGGANVISEAIAAGVPILASRIASSVGLLGRGYPGFFPVGDTAALRALLLRAERDPLFRARLAAWGRRIAPRFAPARERRAWAALLREVRSVPPARRRTSRRMRPASAPGGSRRRRAAAGRWPA